MNRKHTLAIAVVTACTVGLGVGYAVQHDGHHHDHHHGTLAALDRTMMPVKPGEPLSVTGFVDAQGKSADPQQLRGHWSLVFFGYTSCPDVCPTTLATLAAVARDPASGIADHSVQVVFVSVDPKRDTPQRLKDYLAAFDARFVGLTGPRAALERLASQVGAGYEASDSGFDHSTSVFIVDPQGRTAAVLLHPSDPARIIADLASVRQPSS
jgi:protein SCO1/2